MTITSKLVHTQTRKQVEIHETLRTRCLEVVNSKDRVIARIGEETREPDAAVSEKKIATFFDDDGNKVACLKIDSASDPSLQFLVKMGLMLSSVVIFAVLVR